MKIRIGLVSALPNESKSLLSSFDFKKCLKSKSGIHVSLFSYLGVEIYHVESGIGEVSAALAVSTLFFEYNINIVYNFGLCGSLSKNLSVSDICLVDKIVPFQFSLNSADKKRQGKLPNKDTPYIDTSILFPEYLKTSIHMPRVCIASGDVFVADPLLKNNILQAFNCDICDMESYGIFMACSQFKIPCVIIKCVSDSADEKANDDFDNKISNSVTEYVDILKKLIKKEVSNAKN